ERASAAALSDRACVPRARRGREAPLHEPTRRLQLPRGEALRNDGMPNRDLFVRDLGRKIEGVVKVYDEAALADEIGEFVLTDWTEEWLKKFLDTFAESLDRRRKRAQLMDDMGVWVSGFFGSGKSHFAKLVGYVLQNHTVGGAGGDRAMALFEKHL